MKYFFQICIGYTIILQLIVTWRRLILLFLLLPLMFLLGTEVKADDGASVYFRINVSAVEASLQDNASALAALDGALSDTLSRKLVGVSVRASASPDGPLELNARLARERARNIIGRMANVRPIPDSLLKITVVDEDWSGLRDLVERSVEPWKDEVLAIIDKDISSAEAKLRALHRGSVWSELAETYLPALRRADVTFVFENLVSPGAASSGGAESPVQLNKQRITSQVYSFRINLDI